MNLNTWSMTLTPVRKTGKGGLVFPIMQEHQEPGLTGLKDDSPSAPDLGLELVTTLCGGGSCPTVYRTNRGTLVVQGYAVGNAGVDLPAGELLVEIPADLLTAAAEAARQ